VHFDDSISIDLPHSQRASQQSGNQQIQHSMSFATKCNDMSNNLAVYHTKNDSLETTKI
jgi:hypothetical protein